MSLVTLRDIEAAKSRIEGFVKKTPIISSKLLNDWLGHEIFFKAECLQKIGAFKARGGCNAVSWLVENGQKPAKIVANSSGNHAQAIAWASKQFNIPATIFMPSYSSKVKIRATESYGAEVVLLDYNLEKIKDLQSKVKDLCIHCDVRNKKSVKKAFDQICEKYGGIDILISNAGTAIAGSIAEVDDKILRQSFEDNFFSHQNCASEAIKIMKKQNTNGCLLFNISKQSVNPGKNFGPYGLPKSALLSLCKQYAVDYGSYGIRSNGVNADRIRSGLMTDKMIKARAKARSVTATDYMKGNLLLDEVKAEDVAKAFFHLAVSKKTTGAVLTVDGGNIAASLR